jgi:hypothetical protein
MAIHARHGFSMIPYISQSVQSPVDRTATGQYVAWVDLGFVAVLSRINEASGLQARGIMLGSWRLLGLKLRLSWDWKIRPRLVYPLN